jgi:lipopolysaccharide transport system permease protein
MSNDTVDPVERVPVDRSVSQLERTIIEPPRLFSDLDLAGLWQHRELFYLLAVRDIKIRYKQAVLGVAWVVVQPLISTLIFTMIFRSLGIGAELSVPYPLFAFSGFVIWSFMNGAILNCSGCLINHRNLITFVYFPRLILPLAAAAATMVDLAFGLLSLAGVMLIYQRPPAWQTPLVVIPIAVAVMLTLGMIILSASLNVKYRDVKYVLPFILQILFFISPVFYSLSMIDQSSVWLWKLNPLTGILENFRAALFGLPIDWLSLLIAAVVAVVLFVGSMFVFQRMVDDFADVI